ncbi:MAG: TIGR03557 family F420-dependent LLM class oxidoreductase [Solirubrobacteraceae bacterium]
MPRYFHFCSHEQFPPDALLRQAVAAEAAGFDGIACSDHLQPWWEPGESGHALPWLGAVGQATEKVPFGTGVTPPGPRFHPVLIAQAWATLETMFPGRPYLGFGSGESLNESPLGEDWPSVGGQIARMEEALELIHRLYDGERVDHQGRFFSTKQAILHTRSERRPPIYVSAFGPQAAAVAGRWGDGLWTLADPEQGPEIIDAYRSAAEDAGKEPGEILLQVGFSWAADDDAAFEGARVWKSAQVPAYFTDDWHEPRRMYEHAEATISDDDFREAFIVATDPAEHAERIRELEKLGATIMVLQNASAADPEAAIATYRDEVLPALRGGG